jgi:hypothetical protein
LPFVHGLSEEFVGLRAAERLELDPDEAAGAVRVLECARQPLRDLAGTHGQGNEDRGRRWTAKQRAEQLDGGRIRPVKIVQHENDGSCLSQSREQLAHSAVASVPLVLERRWTAGREAGERRKDARELRPDVVVQRAQHLRIEGLNVFLESIHEYPEGQVALELRRGSGEHEVPTSIGTGSELGQDARLAYPGLSHESDRPRLPRLEFYEELVKRTELLGAPDEVLGKEGQFVPKPA